MNDNIRRDAKLVQLALDLKLTLKEIRQLIKLRPNHYAPLKQLLKVAK